MLMIIKGNYEKNIVKSGTDLLFIAGKHPEKCLSGRGTSAVAPGIGEGLFQYTGNCPAGFDETSK